MKSVQARIGDLEIRVYKGFNKEEDNSKYEMIQWVKDEKSKPYCYVVAFFDKKREGYDIRFVGERPFEVKNFMKYAKIFYNLLQTNTLTEHN